jgi:TolA-binding protein
MADQNPSQATLDPPETLPDDAPGRLAQAAESLRVWVNANRLRAAIAGSSLLLITLSGGALLLLSGGSDSKRDETHTVKMALEALDAQNYVKAKILAEEVRDANSVFVEELGGVAFVLGVVTANDADGLVDAERLGYHTLAARYLEEARDRGFPEGRAGEGLFLLGRSLFITHHYPECRLRLLDAMKENLPPDRQRELHHILMGAYMRDESPDYAKALDHNGKYLSMLADDLATDPSRFDGLLERSRIKFKLNDVVGSRQALAKIQPREARYPLKANVRAEVTIMQGRILMQEARMFKQAAAQEQSSDKSQQASRKYELARKTLRTAQGMTSGGETGAKSAYLIGLCYLEDEAFVEAQKQFADTRSRQFKTDEGLAASLHEADLLREHLRQDVEAMEAYRRTRNAAGSPEAFDNRWITLGEFKGRLMAAYDHYLKTKNYENATQIADLLTPMFPKLRSMELKAEAHRAWAVELVEEAQRENITKAEELRAKARGSFRKAGVLYFQISKHHVTERRYPDDLWNSAQDLLRGHDYHNAVKVFNKYLEIESRDRRTQALLGLGESLLAQGSTEKALDALAQCIDDSTKGSAAYRARLLASRAYLILGDATKAKEMLQDNLGSTSLRPTAPEWRDSIFALGTLLYTEGSDMLSVAMTLDHRGLKQENTRKIEQAVVSYRQAIQRFTEAVARYSKDSRHGVLVASDLQIDEARYMIAESYRKAATLPQQKLRNEKISTRRLALMRQINKDLGECLKYHQLVQKSLSDRQDRQSLSAREILLMRNGYFAQGAALFDLGRYDDSVVAYSTATNRFLSDPVVLEAFVQIARCYRHKNELKKSRGVLEQATMILDRMPKNAAFTKTTPFTRAEWIDRLKWQKQLGELKSN